MSAQRPFGMPTPEQESALKRMNLVWLLFKANFKIKTALKTSRVLFFADLNEMLIGSSAQKSGLELC